MRKPDEWVALSIDNCDVHLVLEAVEEADKAKILLVTLIKDYTGDSQPLDHVIFGPFQRLLKKKKTDFMYRDGSAIGQVRDLEKGDIVELAQQAFDEVYTPVNLASAFSSTGIFPPNAAVFHPLFAKMTAVSTPSLPPAILPSPPPAPQVDPVLPYTTYQLTGLFFAFLCLCFCCDSDLS